jgi:hypothetical protein
MALRATLTAGGDGPGYYAIRAKADLSGYYGVYGLKATSLQGNYSFGISAVGEGKYAYGVYADATGSSNEYAGYFSGDLAYTGNLINASDQKFKRNIQNTGPTVGSKLFQLQPKTYRFRRAEYPRMGFPEGQQFGLVAQDVEQVFPSPVSTEVHPNDPENGSSEPMTYKSVNYRQFIPVLVRAVKEQQVHIDSLRSELNALKDTLQSQGIDVE